MRTTAWILGIIGLAILAQHWNVHLELESSDKILVWLFLISLVLSLLQDIKSLTGKGGRR